MKRQPLIFRGTPVVPCLCAIGMVVLWYITLLTDNGSFVFQTETLSFEGLTPYALYSKILYCLIPVSFFGGVLFLAEKNPRWMVIPLLLPVVAQISNLICYMDTPDALLDNPIQYCLPFLGLAVYVFTVEGMIPTKWILVGFGFAAALLPVIVSLCGVGEFTYEFRSVDYELSRYVDHFVVEWSAVLNLSLYYIGLGSMGFQMRRVPAESEEKV